MCVCVYICMYVCKYNQKMNVCTYISLCRPHNDDKITPSPNPHPTDNERAEQGHRAPPAPPPGRAVRREHAPAAPGPLHAQHAGRCQRVCAGRCVYVCVCVLEEFRSIRCFLVFALRRRRVHASVYVRVGVLCTRIDACQRVCAGCVTACIDPCPGTVSVYDTYYR